MTQWLAIVKLPNGSEREHELRAGFTFGRRAKSSCVVDDRTVSADHAIVVEKEGRLYLCDQGSGNHTVILNGPTLQKDQDHPLGPGMVALIGKTRITFLVDQEEAAEPEATLLPAATAKSTSPGASVPGLVEPTLARSLSSVLSSNEKETVLGAAPIEARTAPAAAPASPPAPKTPEADAAATAPARPIQPASAPPAPPRASAPPAREPAPLAARAPAVPAVSPIPFPATPLPPDFPAGESTGQGGTIHELVPDSKDIVARDAYLARVRARLVLDDEAGRRVIDIVKPEFVIGRKSELEADGCRIDHKGVSARHARIFLEKTRFYVEDLESANGTFADVDQVAIEARREIRSETYLRFASVAALFVTEIDPSFNPIPLAVYERATRMLQDQRRVTKSQLRRAEEEARKERRHVGEMLIVHGTVDALTWAEAYKRAYWTSDAPRTSRKVWWWVAGLVLALVAAALAWWRFA